MKASYYIGLDIGGTKCAVVLGNESGEVQERIVFASGAELAPQDILKQFDASINTLLRHANIASPKAFGVSCGGPLDAQRGLIQCPPNLPLWNDIAICGHLKTTFGAPAFLCNDADACAIAEWRFGAGRGVRDMIFLTFGTGLGAGLILNGRLYTGARGLAGEVGHIRLAPDGPEGYGKRGSFEGFCSGAGLAKLGMEIVAHKQAAGCLPIAPAWAAVGQCTAKSICNAAQAGDTTALEAVQISAEYLGRGISVLIDTLNPQRIVIGSVFARAQALFHPKMEEVIRAETLHQSVACCEIVPAALGDDIGDIAALTVAIEGLCGASCKTETPHCG